MMTLAGDRLVLLALCRTPSIDWNLVAREAQRPGGLARLLTGEISERSKTATATRRLLDNEGATRKEREVEVVQEYEQAVAAGARLVTILDDDYPENLRLVFDLPPFLFVRGDMRPNDARAVAVVGTRSASPEGLRKAGRMAHLLAERGVTVVSGLARGVDTAAHQGALDAGGRTIAVMGTGILSVYPKENADLAERISRQGALVSQFWPSAPPASYNFPRRNVVTSGISQGTVVIEASKTSGAKMQARLALQHGKTVFLIKSLATSEQWAEDYLEKHARAIQVEDVDDVVRHLRDPEHISELTTHRRQLALELA